MQWTDKKTVQTVVSEESNLVKYAVAGALLGAVAGIVMMEGRR